jgi:hypothetical protein
MANRFIWRGFFGKRRQPEAADRVPPGQYVSRISLYFRQALRLASPWTWLRN